MSASFVQSAPEIAEEILLKIGGLTPKALATFSRDLLNKEASVETEKLEHPKRMSLSDLQKMAHSNKTDLPKIASVSSDDWADISSDLIKIAKRGEADAAREIFETGAALAAQTKVALNAPGVTAAISQGAHNAGAVAPRLRNTMVQGSKPVGAWNEFKALLGDTEAKHKVGLRSDYHELQRHSLRQNLPQDPAVAIKHKELDNAAAASDKRHSLTEKMIATAPAIGLAAGTPLAAAAIMKNDGGRKKEEVKIYK